MDELGFHEDDVDPSYFVQICNDRAKLNARGMMALCMEGYYSCSDSVGEVKT